MLEAGKIIRQSSKITQSCFCIPGWDGKTWGIRRRPTLDLSLSKNKVVEFRSAGSALIVLKEAGGYASRAQRVV